jgi:hypothetical protein
MIYVGIDVAKDSTTALSLTRMAKHYLTPLPFLTIAKGLKLYFRELNPYQMI